MSDLTAHSASVRSFYAEPTKSERPLDRIAREAYERARAVGDKASVRLGSASGPMPGEIRWTRYEGGKKDTFDGEAQSGTWLAFGDELCDYAKRTHKGKGQGRWFMGAASTNGRCRDVDIEAITVVTLDCDGKGDWECARAVLDEAGIASVAQRSSSHTPEVPKWHLSIPLSVPWSGDKRHWRAIWRWLVGYFAGVAGLSVDFTAAPPSFGFDHTTDRLGQPIFPAAKRFTSDDVPETVVRDGRALDLEEFLNGSGFDRAWLDDVAAYEPIATPTTTKVYPSNGLLALAFAESEMLGQRIDRGSTHGFAVECPCEHRHSCGTRFDSSTIIFDPGPAQTIGHFHCSHSCGDIAANDVLKLLPTDAVARATERWKNAVRVVDAARTTTDDGRPIIRLGPEIHIVTAMAVAALRTDADLYQRAGRLVHVVPISHEEAAQGTGLVPGSPVIRDMPRDVVELRLSKHSAFMKFSRRDGWTHVAPPEDIAAKVHAVGEWDGIRPILGVVESPIMLPDGSILQTAGYHAATGLLYTPSCAFPLVADAPTIDDAREALVRLQDLFVNFDFASPAHRLVPIANIMTIVCRHFIRGHVPGFFYDAPTPGSGKSLLTDAVAIIASGRNCPRKTYPVERGQTDDREIEKVLSGYAMQGAAFLSFDNVPPTVPFGGGALDKYMTADMVDVRVLGRNDRNPRLRWRAVVMATGNNPGYSDDGAARRWLQGRIEPKGAEPDRRDSSLFKYPDLLGHIKSERSHLVVDVLTIARAFVNAGRPAQPVGHWGSFEAWTRLVASALLWAGAPDVTAARVASHASPSRTALALFLDGVATLLPRGGWLAREIIEGAYAGRIRRDGVGAAVMDEAAFVQLCDALEELCPPLAGRDRPDAGRLGKVLRKYKARVVQVDGRALQLVGEIDRKGITKWDVRVS